MHPEFLRVTVLEHPACYSTVCPEKGGLRCHDMFCWSTNLFDELMHPHISHLTTPDTRLLFIHTNAGVGNVNQGWEMGTASVGTRNELLSMRLDYL